MSDLLNITWNDGKYSLIQNEQGRVTSLRHGEPWAAGDNLVFGCNYILSLAQELESAHQEIERLLKIENATKYYINELRELINYRKDLIL